MNAEGSKGMSENEAKNPNDPLEVRLARLEANFNANMEWIVKSIDNLDKRMGTVEGRLWKVLIGMILTFIAIGIQAVIQVALRAVG